MSDTQMQAETKLLVKPGLGQLLLKRSLQSHLIFFAIVAVYFLGLLFLPGDGADFVEIFKSIGGFLFIALIPVVLICTFLARFAHVAIRQKPKHPIPVLLKDYWRVISNPLNLALALPVIVITAVFFHIYVSIKSAIPDIVPFSWDTTFYQWDKLIHFGTDPWKIVHPVFSLNPWLTSILSLNYALWFVFSAVVWGIFSFSGKNPVLRTRFLLTFFLTWALGGSVLAIVFSSAGPVFYSAIGLSPDPYVELLDHLRATNEIVSVSSVGLQETFLSAFTNDNKNLGISAMPSMHNAIALLVAIGAWHINRTFGALMAVHCFFVYVASFYLAWHYAIDAYFSWAITLFFWYFSGFVARWWHARSFVREFDEMQESGRKNERGWAK